MLKKTRRLKKQYGLLFTTSEEVESVSEAESSLETVSKLLNYYISK